MKSYFIWLAKFITALMVLCICVPVLFGIIIAASSSLISPPVIEQEKVVAVVELNGMIVESKEVLEELYTQVEDENVVGIVLDINSPGGAVGPSQAIYSTVKQLTEQKPIVAAMGSVAASGGLYAALGAQKIFSQPGTLTGSIGVILQLPNFSQITEEYGFQMITIKSGALKDVGNSFRPMTETDRDFLQASVNKVREDFVTAVVEGRGLDRETVDAFSDGRVLLGSEALEYGLIDGYGTVYDAAREVYALSGAELEEGKAPTLRYKDDQFERFAEIFGARALLGMVQQFFGGVQGPTSNGLLASSNT
ncbi:signal peptide peptidase SppA [bacterium]|nr:signal peptide peptidase SppA [bacterium]